MRIFYAAGVSPNACQISDSQLWKRNLFDSLVALGHEVISFSRDVTWHFTRYLNYQADSEEREQFLAYRRQLQAWLLDEIGQAHRQAPIDVFFSYFWSEMCGADTIQSIRSMGITTVNWFCNASYQFELVADLAPAYDWNLVPEEFRLEDYRAIGARCLYCQEAANPAVYHPCDLPVDYDVTFVGQAYGDRPAVIQRLHAAGIDVHVWGPGWDRAAERRRQREGTQTPDPRYGGILSDIELVQMYSRSRINLGFSKCGDTHKTEHPIRQIRLRDFEVPMSGGFYLIEYQEELEHFFDIGREIVCYDSREDLVEKIRYYLEHAEERAEAIRLRGRQRCLRDHTWQRRFADAFRQMGLS